MRGIALFTTAAALLLGADAARAQSPWSLELRGGGAVATEDFGDAALGPGVGFEVTARYRVQPHLAIYAGWDWYHFTTDDEGLGEELDIEDTGYAFGLIFQHPVSGRVGGWLRGGGIYDHAELENQAGDITVDTEHGLGWEAGAGLSLELGDRWLLTPGARYRSFSRDLEVNGFEGSVDLSYVALEVGVSLEL